MPSDESGADGSSGGRENGGEVTEGFWRRLNRRADSWVSHNKWPLQIGHIGCFFFVVWLEILGFADQVYYICLLMIFSSGIQLTVNSNLKLKNDLARTSGQLKSTEGRLKVNRESTEGRPEGVYDESRPRVDRESTVGSTESRPSKMF